MLSNSTSGTISSTGDSPGALGISRRHARASRAHEPLENLANNGRHNWSRDLSALRGSLKLHTTEVARALLGDPNPSLSSRRELRYGRKGSLSVALTGPEAGLWYDYETGQGGDLLALIRREHRSSFPDALAWARAFVGDVDIPASVPAPRPAPKAERVDQELANIERAQAIWRASVPITGTPAATYLQQARGIDPGIEPWPADLRFHPQCPFKGQMLPAMVALFRDIRTGQPCGIHRTALKPDGSGKAFDDAKAMLGRARDAVIMLDPFDAVELGVAVCEGIESALSARHSPAQWLRPMWACGSAGAIARFPVLGGVEVISVFADGDATGRRAARALCQRYDCAGLEFDLYEPQSDAADANTILRGAT